jgi:hypothetical protein
MRELETTLAVTADRRTLPACNVLYARISYLSINLSPTAGTELIGQC